MLMESRGVQDRTFVSNATGLSLLGVTYPACNSEPRYWNPICFPNCTSKVFAAYAAEDCAMICLGNVTKTLSPFLP